jgi:tetratricopeptide (TPR) repeat protein
LIGKLFGWGKREPVEAPVAAALPAEEAAARAKAQGNAALAKGEVGEAARWYGEAAQLQPQDPLARLNLGYALLELGRAEDALQALDQAIALRRPADGFLHEALFLRGRARQTLGLTDEALASYRDALDAQPGFEAALAESVRLLLALERPGEALALAQQAQRAQPTATLSMLCAQALHALRRPDEAMAQLDELLAREPEHLGALESRGNLLLEADRNDEARATFERLLAVHGPLPQTLTNLATAHLQTGQPEAACRVCDEGVALHPAHADLHLNRAIAHMLVGDWAEGWRDFEWRWAAWTGGAPPWQDRPQWSGRESLADRSILLFTEQGLGDSIQFVRYVPQVAAQAREVVLLVQPALLPLLRDLAPNCRVLATGEAVPRTDFQSPLLSVPLALGTTPANVPDTVPYLRTDPALVERWRDRLGRGSSPKVGIAWSGNAVHKNDRNRSLPLASLRPLAAAPWQFVSLQPEVRASDRKALGEWQGLLDLGPELRDFADTAAVMESLDLVISVDNSVAHLAGALGRPVWILLPHNPDWRWLMERQDTPWYPTARLYRQPATSAWEPVLAQVRRDLQAAPPPPQ